MSSHVCRALRCAVLSAVLSCAVWCGVVGCAGVVQYAHAARGGAGRGAGAASCCARCSPAWSSMHADFMLCDLILCAVIIERDVTELYDFMMCDLICCAVIIL